MTNTEEFVQNIDSSNISAIVVKFFDELVVLYNIIGCRHNIDICTDDESSVAKFILTVESTEEAAKLFNSLNNTSFSVYNVCYNINMEMNDNLIVTTIYR